jgi:membrane-bound metal-dependent hydrolase YbcI (DUF457 family)
MSFSPDAMSFSPDAMSFSRRRRAEAYCDPFLHALVSAAVVLPLGRRAIATSVAAGLLIDLDHPVAARSVALEPMWTLPRRPVVHSATVAAASGAAVGALAGRRYAWATFAGLLSHVLRDAVEGKTPVLWPWTDRRSVSTRTLVLGTAALTLGSWALSGSR